MARLPYADIARPDIAPLAQQIAAERGSVLHLYRMLLNSPPVAQGWLNFLTAIRQKSSLEGAIREMVIMRVAVVNGAPYEAEQHAPIAIREGMTREQVDALANWETSDLFDARQRAVLAYSDSMTRQIHVPDEVFAAASGHFNEREMVELTATIAAYNMVSRFLEATHIDSKDPV